MKTINFSKLNGQGNDFIIINGIENNYDLSEELISSMCDRHFGIGADGLIIVRKSDSADFFMDYYNHDGSKAEMCGNGIRCMAVFIIEYGLWKNKNLKIDTRSGIKSIGIDFNKSTGDICQIKVNMGKPIFDPERIPLKIVEDFVDDKMNLGLKGPINDYPVKAGGQEFKINCLSMGNPHCVIYLDKDTDIYSFPLNVYGPEIENNKIFPNKTNVEFIKIKNNQELDARVWERGVGETLACGTGACAATVCSIALGKINKNEVKVNLPGGRLDISWNGKNSDVILSGPVEHVFDGKYLMK
jgi:diaminopimelate epimerase